MARSSTPTRSARSARKAIVTGAAVYRAIGGAGQARILARGYDREQRIYAIRRDVVEAVRVDALPEWCAPAAEGIAWAVSTGRASGDVYMHLTSLSDPKAICALVAEVACHLAATDGHMGNVPGYLNHTIRYRMERGERPGERTYIRLTPAECAAQDAERGLPSL